MKNTNPLANPEELTVLVFKDNDSSRTFQIPLGWISRLGLFLGILVGIALLSLFFAVKFYRVTRQTHPSHVIDLEHELSELKITNKTLETKLASTPAPVAAAPVQVAANPAAPLPVPTVTVTVTPAPVAAAPVAAAPVAPAPAASGPLALFSALPHKTQDLSANSSKLPITVSPAKTVWRGKNLNVNFSIQYTATDKGTQQGRIVILARGPETLLAYPEGVLNRAGNDSLIAPPKGEYFSVSRFRETHAEFGPVRSAAQIQDVEILLLSMDGALLAYQKIPAPAAPVAKAAAPAAKPAQPAGAAAPAPVKAAPPAPAAPAAKPVTGNTELIEPGVDQ